VGAIVFGGVLAPVLLMFGLAGMPASGASLLLNAEAVLTVAIAWLVFREHANRHTVAGFRGQPRQVACQVRAGP